MDRTHGRIPAEELARQLTDANVETDNHESDLYVKGSERARKILIRSGWGFEAFSSALDGSLWYDVPFAYVPFWKARS